MEKARQHSAVSFERLAWALVYYAGPLALSFGILAAFGFGNWAVLIGLAVQALSRVIIAIWSTLRPEAQWVPRPPERRIASAVMWSAIALILIVGELR